MASVGLFATAAPYHILAYGSLLGTEVWHTIASLLEFKILARPQFAQLQKTLTPPYFSIQTAMPVLLVLTFPADRTAIGRTAAGLRGVLEPSHRWTVLAPLSVMFSTALVNLVYAGPSTTRVMVERKAQETRDGKSAYSAGPHTSRMQELNRQFGLLHSLSSTLNVIGSLGAIWYGFHLGERLQ